MPPPEAMKHAQPANDSAFIALQDDPFHWILIHYGSESARSPQLTVIHKILIGPIDPHSENPTMT